MATKSVAKNYIYDLIYRILSIITPLVTAPYISRVIGAAGIGDYSYTQSICSYFTLAAILGSNVYGQREIAFCTDDRAKRSKAFEEIMCIRVTTILISTIAYLFLCSNTTGTLQILFLLQTVDIVGLIFDVTWLMQGVEEFKILMYRNIIVKLLSVAAIFVFVRTKQDLYLYVFLTSLAVVIGNITIWPQIKKYVDWVPLKQLSLKRHVLPILSLFLPTIALRLYDAFDKTMLGMITGSSVENGFYEQALKIITMAITIVTSLGNVMSPRMAFLFSQDNKEKVKEYLYNSFEVVAVLALPISAGIAAVSGNLIPWFLGAGYEKDIMLLRYFAIICVAMGIKNVIGLQYLVATKRQNLYTVSILAGLVLNVILNAFLIPHYASLGAVVASVISEYFIVAIQFGMIWKEIDFRMIVKSFLGKIFAAAVMGTAVYLIAMKLPASIIYTCLLVAIGAVIYFAVLMIIRDKSLAKVKDMILRKLKK